MPSFDIKWESTEDCEDPLDAVIAAEESMAEQIARANQGVGGGVFGWTNLDTGEQGIIDLEAYRQEAEDFRMKWWARELGNPKN